MKFINDKEIAILLGVYNGEKFLPEQLNSLINQTNQNWTLYIRDDGSNDNTRNIINEYCARFSNFVYVKDDLGNLKSGRNFLQLLDVVESKYYMFCDHDDVWLPNKIEVTFQHMKQIEINYPNKPIMVHTDKIIVDENLKVKAESHWKSINLNPEQLLTYEFLGVCPCVGGATMMFNRAVKDLTFPIPSVPILHDYWISLQTVKYGIVSTLHIPTISYRQHGSNVFGVTIRTDEKYSLKSKIANLNEVVRMNLKQAKLLKAIGWGSLSKYLFYKFIVLLKLRSGKSN